MALYSTSPPSVSHFTTHYGSCSTLENDAHVWQGLVAPGNRQSRGSSGGLSYLFSNSHSSCHSISDALDSSSLSSVRDHSDRNISIPGTSPFGRSWERSTISILQNPYMNGHSSSTCFFSRDSSSVCTEDPRSSAWRRSSESRAPVFRSEGFEVSNRNLKAEAALLCGQVETSTLTDLLVSNNGSMTIGQPSFVGLDFSGISTVNRKHDSPDQILADAQARHKVFNDPFIVKAFRLAEEAHRGSFRRSGEIYLTHCVETAILLALAGAEATVVAAGLLHDTLDDSNTDEAQIRAVFGDDVADLVVGVSKISQLSQLARDNNIASKTLEADRLRTMFLAMVDVRVVLIKLADRLHNMRTLEALPPEKQVRIANETLEILVPIANRLGIWSWKAEMEDLCFKFLKPVDYQELATKLEECCRKAVVLSAIEQLEKALLNSGIQLKDLSGRSKNLFSIYTKMRKKGRSIDEIYDVRGLRLIVENEKDCYAALDVVHNLWKHIPGKLKDYVSKPKANGYQSLHTVVMGSDSLPLEVQIRTKAMHRHAEYGLAAHWRYKEGNDTKHRDFLLQRVEWARWILTWHSEIMDNKLRVSPSHMDLKSTCPFPFHKNDCPYTGPPTSDDDPLFVIIMKGEKMIVQELPSGCTAADLKNLEQTFSDECSIPRVNHQVVDNLKQKLQMGDVVEISQRDLNQESSVYVTMGRVPKSEEISVYREHILRMYDKSCKADARKGYKEVKESTQVVGLT